MEDDAGTGGLPSEPCRTPNLKSLLQPINKTLLPELEPGIIDFLLTHRLPLMEKLDEEALRAGIASELAGLFQEVEDSDRHVLCEIRVADREPPVGHLWYRLQ